MSRRLIARTSILVALGLLVSACAPAAPAPPPTAAPAKPTSAPAAATAAPAAPPTTAPAAPAKPTEAPKPAAPAATTAPAAAPATLNVVTAELGQTVDWNSPLGVHIPSVELEHNVYDRLIEFKMVDSKTTDGLDARVPDFTQFESRLAESWEYSPDFRTLTFKLRRGVKSNVGNELGAADVVYAAERAFGTKGFAMGAFQRVGVDKPEQVVAKDSHTVEFQLSRPNPSALMLFPLYSMGIIDSTEAKRHTTADDPWSKNWLNKNHAGYGPYKITSWTDSEVILEARPEYYRGAPKIARVVMKQVPEATNRASLVEAGSADIVVDLSLKEIEQVRGKPGLKVVDLPGNEHVFIGFNHRIEPFNNPKVREAVGYAIPYDAILKNVYFGRGRPLKSDWPDTYPGVNDKFYKFTYDPEKARSLLAEAGLGDGFKTTIIYPSTVPEVEQIAVIVRGALAQVKIDVTPEKVSGSDFSQRLFGPTKNSEWWINATSKPMTPAIEYMLPIGWLCTIGVNAAGYCNQRIDQLYQELLVEPDQARRTAITDEIQQLLAEDTSHVGLAQWGHHVAMRSNVSGYGWYTDGRLRVFDLQKQ